jgi:hypothetical protein
MARTVAALPAGTRVTDYISLGVITKTFPLTTVRAVLAASGKASLRERDLPAHGVVYYVIALALFMQVSYREVLRCLLEGLQWLLDPSRPLKVAGKSGISQARTRLGWEAMRQLHDAVVRPIARPTTRGAWYRQWRLVSLDGSTLDVADEAANAAAFGRPGSSRGDSAYPQIRFVSLVENGTHVLFGSQMAGCETGEIPLARAVLASLQPGMLCLADRGLFGFVLWQEARATGAELLWRIKKNTRLPCDKRLPDGSYLSHIYACEGDRRRKVNGVPVRVIEYYLDGVEGAEPLYRLVTSILDPDLAPARELAALYHERWEIETALDELKTHLRGARIVLREPDPRPRAPGVLRADPGAFRHSRPDARGRVAGRRGPRPALVFARRARRAPQARRLRRCSPLSSERPSMPRCSPKSCRSASSPVETAAIPVGSSAR